MTDIDGQTVGYKCLTRQDDVVAEVTYPDANAFGFITFAGTATANATIKSYKDTVASAVLVLNLMDFLALSTQKINCKCAKVQPRKRYKDLKFRLLFAFSINYLSSAWH